MNQLKENPADELLDIVDEYDRPVAILSRSKVYEQKLKTFRVINAFIINSEGKLWIPRRSPHKRLCPSLLDVSVGGHVSQGETYDEAFARELCEELNLYIPEINYEFAAYFSPFIQTNLTAFMKVYKIYTDKTPEYNKEDFTEAFWLSPKELLKKIESGDKGKSDLDKLVKLLFK